MAINSTCVFENANKPFSKSTFQPNTVRGALQIPPEHLASQFEQKYLFQP